MRRETLTTVKGGIDRLRTKGAALKDTLFELVNGFVTSKRTVKVRPGTHLDTTLPAGTAGLVSHGGLLHVFASSVVGGIPAGYALDVLRSPEGAVLSKIHFAKPFLGALYVAAEFADGNTYHFWLQATTIWLANTEYSLHDYVEPTVPNGFVYRATRLNTPFPAWTPLAPRAVDDSVEPTIYNGLYFKVESVIGSQPRSGSEEPIWPTTAGAVIIEDADGTANPPSATPTLPPDFRLPDDVDGRYRIPGFNIP
jgi:hypothetical protein